MQERVDVFVLAALHVEVSQIAVYAIARGAMRLLERVPNALGRVAYPQLAGLSSSDAAEFTCATVRQAVLLLLPMILLLLPAAPLLLPAVYGPAYAASVGCFLILLPCTLLKAISLIVSRYFMAMNRQLPPTLVRLASLLLNVSLALVLIPPLGLPGVAIAVFCSSAFDVVVLCALFVRMSGAGPRDLLVLRRADFAPYLRQVGVIARKLGRGPR
jgi:O-antigen/teichoic acid export membrane protein